MVSCPPFLEPRLRLFLSADIIGSTSLKQIRARSASTDEDSKKGPAWFSAIQGFYFESTQAFLNEWSIRKSHSDHADQLYGDEPTFWKSIGDEVLFSKVLTDHRQVTTTLRCWFRAIDRIRAFLKEENASLDVKCTAWVAGFPYRNREVVIGRHKETVTTQVENYYKESGRLLNLIYDNKSFDSLSVDYIGPSIDTGFRLSSFSSGKKMILSIDVAYLISMTSFDGEIERIDINYDGSHSLKGVMGGAPYPIFWINMSSKQSLAMKEDKLRAQTTVSREDIKEYCDAFYEEYDSFIFRPFINKDIGRTMAKMPVWYEEYHSALVKNFNLPDNEYTFGGEEPIQDGETDQVDDQELQDFVSNIPAAPKSGGEPSFQKGDIVTHKQFGRGKIFEIDGYKIEVDFDDNRRKRVYHTFLRKIT